jgi:hypothetical protein
MPHTSQHQFESVPSAAVRRRLSSVVQQKPNVVATFSSLTPMWVGIAGQSIDAGKFEIALAVHDSVYATDFTSATITLGKDKAKDIEAFTILTLRKFCSEHLCKFLGISFSRRLSFPNV